MGKKQINKEKIIELYNKGYTLIKIGNFFGFKSDGPIKKILKNEGFNLSLRKGSNSRRKSLNEDYFNVIDTPNKAYVLGWVISDGYVTKNKLVFGLKDLEILEFIKKELDSNHKISESLFYDKRTKKTYKQYRLQICSKKISESLNKLGLFQSKSFTVGLPVISKDLYSHLIRGIFDGDGYIGKGKNGVNNIYPRFSLIASQNLYDSLIPIFNSLKIVLKKPSLVAEKNGDSILKILIYRKKDLRIFFNYIYGDGNVPKLERKYNKFKESLGDTDPTNFVIKKFDLNDNLIETHFSLRSVLKTTNIKLSEVYNNIVKKEIKEYSGFKWEVTH